MPNDKHVFIYVVRNLTNGMVYVGQTHFPPSIRLKQHLKYFVKSPVGRALKEQGFSNFSIETVQECSNREEADEAERFWIVKLNSLSPSGYNLTTGGSHTRMSEHTRRKMSASHTGKSLDPEMVKRRSAKLVGRTFTEERCRNISRALTGRKLSNEARKAIADGHRGLKKDAETIRKMSESQKGRKPDAAHRANMALGQQRRYSSLLNKETALCIQQEYLHVRSYRQLSKKHNLSRGIIARIVNGEHHLVRTIRKTIEREAE